MKRIWKIIPTLVLISLLETSHPAKESPHMQGFYHRMRNVIFDVIGRTSSSSGLIKVAKLNKLQTPVPSDLPFPCDTTNSRSQTRPESVHELRPGDIDIVGAMGDSLTAANGAAASRLIDVVIENRGLSWVIGGQGTWREYLTIPNVLKEFNPNLIGYSLADSYSHHVEAQFNVAEIGSMSKDMYFMAKVLVKRIKSDPRVDYEKDWKLIFLMIGSNDFCLEFCYLTPQRFRNASVVHRQELMATLDYLRDNMPRTLVSITLTPNLEILHDLKGLPNYCSDLHLLMCPCLFGKAREKSYSLNIAKQREWQQVQREVTSDDRYRQKNDFAVVLQPFTAHLVFPEVSTSQGKIADKSFLSEDCFHFSQKAYARGSSRQHTEYHKADPFWRAANALWNNLLEPLGNKSENWEETFSRFLCPTEEHPFIFTHGNSFTNQIIR